MTSQQTDNLTLPGDAQQTLELNAQSMWDSKQPDHLEDCLLWLLAKLGNPMSRSALRSRVAREPGIWTQDDAIEALESFGFRCHLQNADVTPGEHLALAFSGFATPYVYTGNIVDGIPEVYNPASHDKPVKQDAASRADWRQRQIYQVEHMLRQSETDA